LPTNELEQVKQDRSIYVLLTITGIIFVAAILGVIIKEDLRRRNHQKSEKSEGKEMEELPKEKESDRENPANSVN